MNARTQALLWDFLIWFGAGFVVAAAPIIDVTLKAGPDNFDGKLFLWALLSAVVAGILGALRKLLAPQLVSLENSPGEKPTVVGVSYRNINPAPVKVDQVEQQRPTVETLDAVGANKVDQ